jgi:carnitine 3-dehydrogenase / betainyl-CoA thioesterase
LTDVPDLDAPLLDKLVAQSDAQAAGRSIAELEQLRDDCLVAVLAGLRGQDFGAGETVAQTERRWLSIAAAESRAPTSGPDGLLHLHDAIVTAEWIDYNGHMTEYRYLQVLADATDAFLARIGADPAYVAAGHSYYTVESHLRHLGEAHAGDRLSVTTRLLGHDQKRLHLFHELRRSGEEALVATGEHMLLHVDAAAGRAAPAGAGVLAELGRIAAGQAGLPAPGGAGRRIEGERLRAGRA